MGETSSCCWYLHDFTCCLDHWHPVRYWCIFSKALEDSCVRVSFVRRSHLHLVLSYLDSLGVASLVDFFAIWFYTVPAMWGTRLGATSLLWFRTLT